MWNFPFSNLGKSALFDKLVLFDIFPEFRNKIVTSFFFSPAPSARQRKPRGQLAPREDSTKPAVKPAGDQPECKMQ